MEKVRLHGYQNPLAESLSDETLLELNHYAAKDIAKRAMSGPIICLLGMLATMPLSELLTDEPIIGRILIILMFSSTLFRYLALRALPNLPLEKLESWRLVTSSAILSLSIIWGAYLGVNIYFYGFNISTMVIIIFTVAIAAGGTMAMFIWQRLAQVYAILVFLPMYLFVIFLWDDVSISIFTGVSLMVIYLYLQASRSNREYWLAIYNNKLLEVKAGELHLETEKSERSREEAEKANQAKSEFLSSMSHELRTPLNAILGFAQLLEMDGENDLLNEDQHENVTYIRESGEHLLVLISQVLELSKIEQGKLDVSLENLKVSEVIDECLPLLINQAEKRNIQIEQKNHVEGAVKADRMLLKQVLLNLMSNAIKYNKENGSVILDCSIKENNTLIISVIDTGTGIPKEQQRLIFTAFSRLGKEVSSIEGTGIGLIITKRLVEAMNGNIGFESTEDVGSTFWIALPLADNSY